MSTETDNEEKDAAESEEVQNEAGDGTTNEQSEGAETEDVNVSSAEFQELNGDAAKSGNPDLSRIQNIQVEVTAELGRTTIPIQKLMQVAEGSVVELDREINSPIDLCAQGTPLATGEVIVVDGNFAIRITHVYANQQ